MWPLNLAEAYELKQWLGPSLSRSPLQHNTPFTADCELVQLGPEFYLAATVDSICEEISCGLYRDPYTQGWMAATASLSDLAAVGADPQGLLCSTLWGPLSTQEDKARLAEGLKAALEGAGVHLLGGDTGRAATTTLTSVGLGLIRRPQPITRLGLQPGDWLVASGPCGDGPALAYRLLLDASPDDFPESCYRPFLPSVVRQAFATYAHAMIDTSDGVLAACHTLCQLNSVGLSLHWDEDFLSPQARAFCRQQKIPLWALWIAEHGDYQLLAAIKPDAFADFMRACPTAYVIARVEATKGMFLQQSDRPLRQVDPTHAQLVAHTPAALRQQVCRDLIASLQEDDYL